MDSEHENADAWESVSFFSRYFYKGFRPRYVWQDGKIGTKSVYQGRSPVPGEDLKVWTGLFLDLIFVALIAQLTLVLTTCSSSFSSLGYCYGVLSFFYVSRSQFDEYCIRFSQDDILHRIYYFIYTLSILFICSFVGMSYEVTHNSRLLSSSGSSDFNCSISNDYYTRFGYALFVNRLTIMALYVLCFLVDKSGKSIQQFMFRIVCGIGVILLYLVSDKAISDSNSKIVVFIILCELDTLWTFCMLLLRIYWDVNLYVLHYPIPYLYMQERNGVFVLVIMGEVIIAMISSINGVISNQSLQNTFFGFLLIFSLATTYFDTNHRLEGDQHAVRRNAIAGFCHGFIMHKNLGYFLLLISAAVVTGNSMTSKGPTYLCYGVSGASICMLFGKKSHKGFAYHMATWYRRLHLGSSVMIVGAHLALQGSYLSFENSLIAHSMLAVASMLNDVVYTLTVHRSQPRRPKSLDHKLAVLNPPESSISHKGDGDYQGINIGIDCDDVVREDIVAAMIDDNADDI